MWDNKLDREMTPEQKVRLRAALPSRFLSTVHLPPWLSSLAQFALLLEHMEIKDSTVKDGRIEHTNRQPKCMLMCEVPGFEHHMA